MRRRANRLPSSTFTRLLLVFLLTGLLLDLLVVAFFAWTITFHGVRPADRQRADYVTYLVGELGDPPSAERAAQISRRSSLAIGYEGTRERWFTGREALPWRHLRLREIEGYQGVRIGGQGRRQVVVVEQGGQRLVFELPRRLARPSAPVHLLFLVASVVTLLVGGAWLVMRQVVRPLEHIADGVAQVAAGNLSHTVPEVGSREFATLAHAFNEMTDRVQQMLAMRERLLRDASHELRSPPTRMKVALEFVPQGTARESLREDLVEMEQLVTAILESARLARAGERIRRQRLDLAAVLGRVTARFADRPPGVLFDGSPAPRLIEGDPDLVATVLRNIVDNALKYSAAGAAPVRVSLEERAGEARVTVRDNGPGIPPANLRPVLPCGPLPLPRDRRLRAGFEPLQIHRDGARRLDRRRERRRGGHDGHRGLPLGRRGDRAAGVFPARCRGAAPAGGRAGEILILARRQTVRMPALPQALSRISRPTGLRTGRA